MCKKYQEVFFTRLWYKDEVISSILQGLAKPKIIVGVTVGSGSRNKFHLWMNRWGVLHGWKPLCAMKHQKLSIVDVVIKNGGCVLTTAHGGSESSLLLVANDQEIDTLFP